MTRTEIEAEIEKRLRTFVTEQGMSSVAIERYIENMQSNIRKGSELLIQLPENEHEKHLDRLSELLGKYMKEFLN